MDLLHELFEFADHFFTELFSQESSEFSLHLVELVDLNLDVLTRDEFEVFLEDELPDLVFLLFHVDVD